MRAPAAASVDGMSTKEEDMSTSLAVAPPVYQAPAIGWAETAQVVDYVVWAIVVGFAFSLALAYAAYCSYIGGDPDISFGWTGFKVTCRK
jgi:hypothetical protein